MNEILYTGGKKEQKSHALVMVFTQVDCNEFNSHAKNQLYILQK